MNEQESQIIRKSLRETIQWCSRHDLLSSAPETPEFRRRWNLLETAGKLLRGAEFQSVEWNEGRKLLAEADPDNLVPLKSQLRSPELTPSAEIGHYSLKTSEKSIVNEVVSKRASLLASDSFNLAASRQSSGRLLIYEPTENVSDGASQVSSHGFFDLYDAPPWDTWVHYAENRELICWVPEALISLAQKGIDANPVNCIHWADPRLLKQLQ